MSGSPDPTRIMPVPRNRRIKSDSVLCSTPEPAKYARSRPVGSGLSELTTARLSAGRAANTGLADIPYAGTVPGARAPFFLVGTGVGCRGVTVRVFGGVGGG